MANLARQRDAFVAAIEDALQARQPDRAVALAQQAPQQFPAISLVTPRHRSDAANGARPASPVPPAFPPNAPDPPVDAVTLRAQVATALALTEAGAARDAVVAAERAGTVAKWVIALCKARILLHEDDAEAARVILVMALEADPDAQELRQFLARMISTPEPRGSDAVRPPPPSPKA